VIGISGYSAVFSREVPELSGLEHVEVTGQLESSRTYGPAARYACCAFEIMNPDVSDLGLVTLCGPSGSTVSAFDKSWELSSDGTLTGKGFAEKRHKRIHPFTLVQALQNQIPAALSMKYKITGPCLNLLDSATALAHALPNIHMMLERCGQVLLVMASAGGREEETAKLQALQPNDPVLEGAICLLLNGQGSMGSLEPGTGDQAPSCSAAAPVLSGGLGILSAMAGNTSRLITLNDFFGHHASIYWRNN